MKDLTKGHPGKVLAMYSLPLFGSVIFQQLYNIADSFVAGRWLGTEALAAVGNSYEITLMYIAMAMGCNIGASVITANTFGQKRYEDVKTCVNTALLFAAALALTLTLIGTVFCDPLLRLINTPAEIFVDSGSYMRIYLTGYLFLMLYNVSTGIFSALGDSKTPFLFLAVSSVANIFVDILFVAVFGMGVEGVAWATFLCQSVSGIVAAVVILRKVGALEGRGRLFSFHMLKKILFVAAPSAVQQMFISVGNIVIQGVINSFGTAATAGYAAAIKLNNMCISSLTTLSGGMSNYTAQNVGGKKYDRLGSGVKWGIALAVAVAACFTLVFLIGGPALVGLFITDGNREALQIGVDFLHIVAPFYCLICIKITCDGALRGDQQMLSFTTATTSDLVLRVGLSILFSRFFGTVGIWASWPVGWLVGTLVSVLFFRHWMLTRVSKMAKNS